MRQVKVSLFIFMTYSLFAAGCINIPPLDCTEDSECKTSKIDGICVKAEGLPGACGLPDSSCASGYRFYKDSSGGRSNLCATLPTFDLLTDKTSVDEHAVFKLHVTAKDGSGQKFLSYKGTPTVSGEWGDARVFSSTGFVNGEADYTLWLNRETNAKDGAEHITVKDGAMVGRSVNIDVTRTEWTPLSTSLNEVLNSTFKITSGISIRYTPSGYAIYFTAISDPNPTGFNKQLTIFVAAADPFKDSNWYPQAALKTVDISWADAVSLFSSGIAIMADYQMMAYKTGYPLDSGFARSTDGVKWTNISEMPFTQTLIQGVAECDHVVTNTISLLKDSENTLRIFYRGAKNDKYFECTAESSDDGKTWSSGKQINISTELHAIWKEGSIYRTSENGEQLTSRDLITWARSDSNPSDLQKKLGLGFRDEKSNKFLAVVRNETTKKLEFYSRP